MGLHGSCVSQNTLYYISTGIDAHKQCLSLQVYLDETPLCVTVSTSWYVNFFLCTQNI